MVPNHGERSQDLTVDLPVVRNGFHCEVAKCGFGSVRSCADHHRQSVQRSTIFGRSDRDRSPLVFAVSTRVRACG
jgi:hypothetical protein